VNGACSTTQCRTNFIRCGNTCIPNGMCCRANGCCEHSDCGTCQKCVSGSCVNQGGGEDLKNECASGTCRTGNCNGNGGCGLTANNQNGPGCSGECEYCMGGSCQDRGDGQTCNGGRCNGGTCMICGGTSQPCCPGSTRCSGNLACNPTTDRCQARAADGSPCPSGGATLCSSGKCADGVCCKVAACASGLRCGRGGECLKPSGNTCDRDAECFSGDCEFFCLGDDSVACTRDADCAGVGEQKCGFGLCK
jgi:hypothetical protein